MQPGKVLNLSLRLLAWGLIGLQAKALAASSEPFKSSQTPQRVVSMNLCTDQLAMLLAAPGQLHSVSYIAADPLSSAMVDTAQAYPLNHGLAEEIYLMQPDLVIAGAFSARATVAMLQHLNIPVAIFQPAYSLNDVRERIRQMGQVLHRPTAAARMVAKFDARLTALAEEIDPLPRAALYYANGYTSGDQTLAGQILRAAGFANVATDAGYASSTRMPLEVLAMTNPDLVITSHPYPGGSRAEEIMDHPVVRHFREQQKRASLKSHDWICGTPYVLRAIENLIATRHTLNGRAK